MRFLFITNSAKLARFVAGQGVDRIFVDLETLGKEERQGHLNTLISQHEMVDVEKVRSAVPECELLVRLNPNYPGSQAEVEAAIDSGADLIMLPMFRKIEEIETFADLIAGRARFCPLVETKDAAEIVGQVAAHNAVDELHIGLNDLSIDLGLGFMFEPLANGLIDSMAAAIRQSGKPFGIGGLARADEGILPARLILAEHVRLGSSGAILSRTFHRQAKTVSDIRSEMDFAGELATLRCIESEYLKASAEQLAAAHIEVVERIKMISSPNAAERA